MNLHYNTSENKLRLPQYGRMVQEMIDHAKTLPAGDRRQAEAEKIIKVMAQVSPQAKNKTPNYEQTLWNHLAYMAQYKLDIVYPCEIEKRTDNAQPHKLSYPGHSIRLRHYGYLVEAALETLKNTPRDAEEREELIRRTALRMKRHLADWKGDGIENDKVGRDMEMYTEGAVSVEEAVKQLETINFKIRTAPTNSGRFSRRKK